MRIIAGSLKGRIIPFQNSSFGDAAATPQRVKEALFSILGEDLSGLSFLDLYACSGQMGLEAASRGCAQVVFNETDRRRGDFIRRLLAQWDLGDTARLYALPAHACIRLLGTQGLRFDYIYVDPPYRKIRGEAAAYGEVLLELSNHRLLNAGGRVIAQHYIHNVLSERYGLFIKVDARRYGTNGLSFYQETSESGEPLDSQRS